MKKTDYLVVGTGIAGLTFALEVADSGSVLLITKKQDTESNTNYAQGGIAAPMGPNDSPLQHIEDTLFTGAGLSDRKAVEVMVNEGAERIRDLQSYGVEFSFYWEAEKKILALGREGGHSADRIVHKADFTGREVEQTLISRCEEHPNIQIEEHSAAVELLISKHNHRRRVIGIAVLDREEKHEIILSRITLLATGGCGRVYLHTTNPEIATGDGLAMAYRAGARIANLEFMQFHPTALYPPIGQAFLISEAVRGFGGVLRTSDGDQFMSRYHPQGDLAPRDVVARTIDLMMKTRGDDNVYLDITGRLPDAVRKRFPNIYSHCLEKNIDITREWIPVVPAAHYMCGGVVTDLHGRTSLLGLYAAGEVAWSGVHGANRLASNSLLEAIVFAHRASVRAQIDLKQITAPVISSINVEPISAYSEEEWVLVSHDWFEIRKLMWDYVGIVRSTLRLERARRRVELIRREVEELCSRVSMTKDLVELRNIALVATLIIRSAMKRRESRGLHFNTDYPELDTSHPPGNTYLRSQRRRQLKS